MSNYTDYKKEPLEIYEETTWVVYDPWAAQEIGIFLTEEAAKLFAKAWEKKHGRP